MRTALSQVAANALRSDEALKDAMERISAERRRGVAGYVLETSDLHHLEFPDVLMGQGSPEIEIGVTHYEARDGGWGQSVILFVVLEGDPGATAATALPQETLIASVPWAPMSVAQRLFGFLALLKIVTPAREPRASFASLPTRTVKAACRAERAFLLWATLEDL